MFRATFLVAISLGFFGTALCEETAPPIAVISTNGPASAFLAAYEVEKDAQVLELLKSAVKEKFEMLLAANADNVIQYIVGLDEAGLAAAVAEAVKARSGQVAALIEQEVLQSLKRKVTKEELEQIKQAVKDYLASNNIT